MKSISLILFLIISFIKVISATSSSDISSIINPDCSFNLHKGFSGPDQNIEFGQDALLNAMASFSTVTWSWWHLDFLSCANCANPIVVKPDHNILFTIEVTDQNGCSSSDEIAINVANAEDIYFPNIFSSNGDGINDIVALHSNSNIRVIKSLRIYDRWGDVITEQKNFLSNDPKYGWDGTWHGKELNPGVFIWIAEVEFENGDLKVFSGEITLLK